MLHILLLLLKIIGCLILILLGLVFLVLAVILLVPVKYRVSASRYASVEAEGHITWLFRLIELFCQVDTEKEENQRLHIRLRIACFCIYDNLRPKKERIKKQTERETKKKETEEKSVDAIGLPETEEKTETEVPGTDQRKTALSFIKALWENLTMIFQRIAAVPSSISNKVQALAGKAEALGKKKEKLLAICHDEKNHLWLMTFLGRLKRLMIRLMPGIDRFFWHFGFDDPAVTGQVLGALSILYPLCGDRMVLQPEFSQETMEGEIKLHGSVRILPIAVFVVRSFLNRQFFSIVKQIKRI